MCAGTLNRLPIVLQADSLNSWHVVYICSFVTFFQETNNSRQVKRWLPVLQSETVNSQLLPSYLPEVIYRIARGQEGKG